MKCRMRHFIGFCNVCQDYLNNSKLHLNLEILTCDPLICTMRSPRFIVSNQMEEFISIQRVKVGTSWREEKRYKEAMLKILAFFYLYTSLIFLDEFLLIHFLYAKVERYIEIIIYLPIWS